MQECLTLFTVILTKIVVEHKILDALLFLALRLLLASHSNRKVGVSGKLQRSSLNIVSLILMSSIEELTCCLFPFFVSTEKAIFGAGAGASESPSP